MYKTDDMTPQPSRILVTVLRRIHVGVGLLEAPRKLVRWTAGADDEAVVAALFGIVCALIQRSFPPSNVGRLRCE
jgi:hypothetical protein